MMQGSDSFRLIVRRGPQPNQSYELNKDIVTLGRDITNDIVINDAEISRRHARLTFQGGKYVLEDLGSTNGTFVNGQRLAGPRVLKAGEVVSFGEQIILVFEVTNVDAGATVVSPRAAAIPSASRPPTPPPPAPAEYAGSVPASPLAAAEPPRKTNLTPFIIAGVVLLCLCTCVGILWYIDANFLWCNFLPFLSGC